MKRSTVLMAVAFAAMLLVAVPAVGLAISDGPADDGEGEINETPPDEAAVDEAPPEDIAPGERLSGAVGAGQAELDGDLEQRSFGIGLAQAASQGAQADLIADRIDDIEGQLAALEEQKAELDAQLAAGEISEGKHGAQMSKLAAQSTVLEQLSNQSAAAAGQLPEDVLEDRGVNTTKLQTLKANASELSGGEVAAIARNITGHGPGDTPAGGPPGNASEIPGQGPPDDLPGQGPSDGNQTGEESPDDMPGQNPPENTPEEPPEDPPEEPPEEPPEDGDDAPL